MKFYNFWEIFVLLIGFIVGVATFLCIYSVHKTEKVTEKSTARQKLVINGSYNTTLADKLFNEIKILCIVLTYPENHKERAIHVKNTWGNRCNKVIFLTTEDDTELEATALPIEDYYAFLWGKVKLGFEMVYEKYFDDYDWFVKGDDDSYFITENLRYMLYQYHTQTAIVIGHKYSFKIDAGYMSGGGYIMSKKATEKFVKRVLLNKCEPGIEGAEDVFVAKCLQNDALFIDGHDTNYEKQIFPMGIEEHFKKNFSEIAAWYRERQWAKFIHGNLSCCSEELVCVHYTKPEDMYMINYLLYNVYPFGLVKNYRTELPRKLTFDELKEAADEKSSVPYSREHEIVHNFDDDEKF